MRESGIRTGFRLRDISSGSEGWLARKNGGTGPKIGSYTVVSDTLDRIGAKALETSTSDDIDLVLVDEIGPMEMTSANFRNSLSDLLNGKKMVVATVKQGSRYGEVEKTLNSGGAVLLELTRENCNSMLQQIISRIESRALAEEQGTP